MYRKATPDGARACWPKRSWKAGSVMRSPIVPCKRSLKNELKPHLKRTRCIGTIDAAFLCQLEHVLDLYAQAYDPAQPVVCFDERPCFLIGDVLLPQPIKLGKSAKQHSAYEKLGSCSVLCAIEPQTGKRFDQVYERRTKKEFAHFCVELAKHYPQATKIHLVLDNLNTHTASSLYHHLPADQAFALTQRFHFHYTPKSASWLNMIECEFSMLSHQCLHRRIATREKLRSEVLALLADRAAKAIKIHWQFSIQAGRSTLHSSYTAVNPDNQKLDRT